MVAEESGKFWDAGCWLPLLSLTLCILCVTGFALLNQLNLLFTIVTFGFGIYFLSGACWFSYTGLKELHRIKKQRGSKLWENDGYIVQELARPLPISTPLLSGYHSMDTLSPRAKQKRVLKHGKRQLAEWQQNLMYGLVCLVSGIEAFQRLLFPSQITALGILNRFFLCIFLIFMLCLLVGITIGIVRSILRKIKSIPESSQSMTANKE